MKSLNKKKILQKNTYEINRHEIGYVFLWEYIHYDNVMHCFLQNKVYEMEEWIHYFL